MHLVSTKLSFDGLSACLKKSHQHTSKGHRGQRIAVGIYAGVNENRKDRDHFCSAVWQ